jgi:putative glycosyltransferase (TIGR04372 family)
MVIKKFRKLWFTASVSNSVRLENKMKIVVGARVSSAITKSIKFIALKTPSFILILFPSSLTMFLVNSAFRYSGDKNRILMWINRISNSKKYLKQYIHSMANLKAYFYGMDKAYEFINSLRIHDDPDKRLYAIQWAFFNFNQSKNTEFLKRVKKFNEHSEEHAELQIDKVRYLPEHTKHMGHLGHLFLYANYYSKVDPSRTVAIWPNISPNKFYLNELLKEFPLKVKLMSESDSWQVIDSNLIDTMFYSKLKNGNWRFEPLIAAGTGQIFPEFKIEENSLIKSNLEYSDQAIDVLKTIGFNPNKWFIALHVKEEKIGFKLAGENRDAEIDSYRLACRLVNDFGGQVVRMGNKSFPNLPKDFPALDYANSNVQADFVDFWLWANCRFWVGNGNGASGAIIPFGKRRIITNQWPYDSNGPVYDMIVPKLLYDLNEDRILTFKQTTENELGRVYARDKLNNSGFSLVENSPETIRDSVLEFIEPNNPLDLESDLEKEFYSATNTPIGTPIMKFSSAFKSFYQRIGDRTVVDLKKYFNY